MKDHNDLVQTHIMLEAGIVPILPDAMNRADSLRVSFSSMSRSNRRAIKRKYRKLVRKSGAYLLRGYSRAMAVNHYLVEK